MNPNDVQAFSLDQTTYHDDNAPHASDNIFEGLSVNPEYWQMDESLEYIDQSQPGVTRFTIAYNEKSEHSVTGNLSTHIMYLNDGVNPVLPLQNPGYSDRTATQNVLQARGGSGFSEVTLPTLTGQKLTFLQCDTFEEVKGDSVSPGTFVKRRSICRAMINMIYLIQYADTNELFSEDIWQDMVANFRINGIFVPYSPY